MGRDALEIQYDWQLCLASLYDSVDLVLPWDWRQDHQDDLIKSNKMPSSKAQRVGAIAESRFTMECLERNFEPHLPTTPMPWDFIVTCPAGTLKVQVKSSSFKQGPSYSFVTRSGCKTGYIVSEEVDVVACFASPEDLWWMIPRSSLTAKTIRLNPKPDSTSKYKKYQNNWSVFYE